MDNNCHTCLHRCMDMGMDPYCSHPIVLKRMPYGRALYTGTPEECREPKSDDYRLWEKDVRGGK